MKTYELRCMSFDGEYVTDLKGNITDCRNASYDMGSKWIFYPWHVIVTESNMIHEAYGNLYILQTEKSFIETMFNGRKFDTYRKAIIKTNQYCIDNDHGSVGFPSR